MEDIVASNGILHVIDHVLVPANREEADAGKNIMANLRALGVKAGLPGCCSIIEEGGDRTWPPTPATSEKCPPTWW